MEEIKNVELKDEMLDKVNGGLINVCCADCGFALGFEDMERFDDYKEYVKICPRCKGSHFTII